VSEDLGRRAVACKAWLWMDGMLALISGATWSIRITDGGGEVFVGQRVGAHGGLECVYDGPACGLPGFSDPATLGCLLDLVMSALDGHPNPVIAGHHRLRVMDAWKEWAMGSKDERAACMVEALEAAQEVEK